jgi:hypothetical protein
MNAAVMSDLTAKVLTRFAEELAEAGDQQLRHLAQRAEARYTTNLGDQMRVLVDTEVARRFQIRKSRRDAALELLAARQDQMDAGYIGCAGPLHCARVAAAEARWDALNPDRPYARKAAAA